MKKQTIKDYYGIEEQVYAWKVSFYEGGEKQYKSGAAADKFARKCAREGKWCSLLALTMDGWQEVCCC